MLLSISVNRSVIPRHNGAGIQKKGGGKMKKHIHLKRRGLLVCLVIASVSAAALAAIVGNSGGDSFKAVWIKMWEMDGRVLDMQFQIGCSGSLQKFVSAVTLETYPFQFDISDLGDVSAEAVRGVIYGSRITSDGKPESPVMVRWWVAKKDEPDPKDSIPPQYPLTLKLRVFDSDGTEFNPARETAMIIHRSNVL